jgi:flagellar hook-basal body complex protein FliE
MDGGGLTDAERDGQRFLADVKKRMGEEEAKAKEEAKHAQKVAKKFAQVFRKVCEEVVAKQGAASRM